MMRFLRRKMSDKTTWLHCDECGHVYHEGEKGYWGMYGINLCCPICLNKHMKKEMER